MSDRTHPSDLPARLAAGDILLLDAAMGTDLDRRGLITTLPLWSARGVLERPDLVRQIHVDNLRAGADIIITNTFRTTGRTLDTAGLDPARAAELDAIAVRAAQDARVEAGRPDALIAGSIAPLEDCYSPELMPPPVAALAEHRTQARSLAAAGVDFIMVETIPGISEAVIALRAARETGLPVTVGFVCAPALEGGVPALISGESLADAVAAVLPLGPAALLVNCAGSSVIAAALQELARVTDLPTGGYANSGIVDDVRGWEPDAEMSGAVFATGARSWLEAGARMIGGCCGTGPEHTAALRTLIDAR